MGRDHRRVRRFTDEYARVLLASMGYDPIGRGVDTPRGVRYMVADSGGMAWMHVVRTTGTPRLERWPAPHPEGPR